MTNKEGRRLQFMGRSDADARFNIIPIAWESAPSFGKGGKDGWKAVLEASVHLEDFDVELGALPANEGIATQDVLAVSSLAPKAAMLKIASVARRAAEVSPGVFPLFLGGDHAITIGITDGFRDAGKCFDVVIFDAHADFRYSWQGSFVNHACVARRCSAHHNVLVFGVRSADSDELSLLQKSKNARALPFRASKGLNSAYLEQFRAELKKLKREVYLSFDVDVLDPAVVRGTGTPEPGGLSWFEALNALRVVFEEKNVLGADVVEFSPSLQVHGDAYFVAKLVYALCVLASQKK
ncbi:hypothetical protein D6783_01105 [Candidatus Woesearchaeota archaeon]|nr:MAG: hypothetical protein D6783_01105 [Candidatus Woesearchaeota archaeon]